MRRIELPASGWSTPAHEHGRGEEIFYVLAGSGISWQRGETAAIGAGDCIVYHPPTPRPATIVNLDEVDPDWIRRPLVERARRDLGCTAGSRRTGLNHFTVVPGGLSNPLHCHSVEEEIFVILSGEGTLILDSDETPVRAGHAISRPAGTGVAHALRGETELMLPAYGTRDPGDACWYPRSKKISFRGLKVTARVQGVDYWGGED